MVVAVALDLLLPVPSPSSNHESSTATMVTRTASKAISCLFPSISSISCPTPTTLLCASASTSHHLPLLSIPLRASSTKTPYPLYYELVAHSPTHRPRRKTDRSQRRATPPQNGDHGMAETEEEDDGNDGKPEEIQMRNGSRRMDKAKRKYLRKMAKRMYGGTDSDDDWASRGEEPVELKPEVVEFPTLHRREEELYFYDMFALPWEKDKHYRMVYQLEKKYFPDQCFDKAFVDAEPEEVGMVGEEEVEKKKIRNWTGEKKSEEKRDDKGLVFFEKEREKMAKENTVCAPMELSERKVGDFFKKKTPTSSGGGQVRSATGEPFLSSRKTGLPPKWDGPSGTIILVNKPKGWTSFTVCGKLRRLVKVQKVGHAGTLDPMATGLLIVGVGKATKLMDRYQGMIKGYSGIFRLGEATSTWDADSPVIQREPWEHIKDVDIRKAAASFCGEIWQVPPMFSAVKVGGEKMYDKARKGEMVELSPRRISIFQFDIDRSLDDRQNLMFRVTCSKGTYIRSLCADFGKSLGSCAHLTALRRDSIGEYSADDAWDFQELQDQITAGYL